MLFCLREVPVGIALLLDDTNQGLPRSENVGLEERCCLAPISFLADCDQCAVFLLGALLPTSNRDLNPGIPLIETMQILQNTHRDGASAGSVQRGVKTPVELTPGCDLIRLQGRFIFIEDAICLFEIFRRE